MKKMFAIAVIGILCLGNVAFAQFAATGTTQLQLNVGPEAGIQINTATTNLTTATSTLSSPFTGTTSFNYKIRTTKVGGTGNITSLVTTDFSAGGGGNPSVANPPVAGDALTYTCTVAAPASACSGSVTASTTAAQNVATFGADAHANSTAGSVDWSLPNDAVYPTGSYTATVTFTISVT